MALYGMQCSTVLHCTCHLKWYTKYTKNNWYPRLQHCQDTSVTNVSAHYITSIWTRQSSPPVLPRMNGYWFMIGKPMKTKWKQSGSLSLSHFHLLWAGRHRTWVGVGTIRVLKGRFLQPPGNFGRQISDIATIENSTNVLYDKMIKFCTNVALPNLATRPS